MLVLVSLISGVILMLLGLARFGRIVARVPHSIIVGFTIGIAVTIALSQVGEVLGLTAKMGYGFFDKMQVIAANAHQISLVRHRARPRHVPDHEVPAEGLAVHPRAADRHRGDARWWRRRCGRTRASRW